jgi:hypothetical protein
MILGSLLAAGVIPKTATDWIILVVIVGAAIVMRLLRRRRR